MAGRVIPHQVWKAPDGQAYSIFTSWKPEGSVMVTKGFTIAWPDGTTGTGRKPFETEADAQAYADAHPNFSGMSQG